MTVYLLHLVILTVATKPPLTVAIKPPLLQMLYNNSEWTKKHKSKFRRHFYNIQSHTNCRSCIYNAKDSHSFQTGQMM